MSKQLIKILVICALVVVCPLVIVGVSLMATEAVGCTLTIYDGGVETLQATGTGFGEKDSKVSIMIDGKEQETNKVTVTKRTEITVTFEGTGYDFVGWYNGKYNEINRTGEKVDKAVSDKVSYTFKISKNTVLTAVRDVKSYTVNYHESEASIEPYKSEQFEYNQAITEIPVNTEGFQGWYSKIEGIANQIISKATFEKSGEINLYPAYENQMLVKYFKGAQEIGSARLFESEVAGYTLPVVTDDIVKNNLSLGYEFAGWANQTDNSDVTSFTYDVNGINLVMKENIINYTLNVKYHALSNETKALGFNVNGFAEYNTTRENYTFVGLEYNGTTYNYDSTTNTYGALASVILAGSQKTLDVTAVWECDLPQGIVFNMYTVATFTNGETTDKSVTTGTNLETGLENEQMYITGQTVYFKDKEGKKYFDTTTDIRDIFINRYTDVVNYTGESVSFTGVVNIAVAVDGNYITIQKGYIEYNFADSAITFQQIISLVKDFNDGSIDNVTNININFIFE